MSLPEWAPIREILLGTDFSDTSEAAASVARECALQWAARVHLFHVTWPQETDVTTLLGRLVAEFASIPTVVRSVPAPDAARAIVSYARDHTIDLIVVGTHGRTGFSHALLGSVAERVVRTAPCPVLTVPNVQRRREPPVATTPEPRRCLVCATVTEDLVCEHCRAIIRGEAIERTWRDERAGHP
jgi:nucleotide-binding universal stress UspA family protein